MVKTRSGRKRASLVPPESESPDSKEKKVKLDSETKSKYFTKINVSAGDHTKDSGLDLDGDTTYSNDSVILSKSNSDIKEESDSDDSSSDEFMKAPFSLDQLGEFKTLKKEPVSSGIETVTLPSSTVSRLSDDSENEMADQEYYDFSQIIQSQELITNTQKDQEEKAKLEKEIVVNGATSKSRRGPKKLKLEKKCDIKSIGEELGISDLLAIAEGSGRDVKEESYSSEDEDDNLDIKTEETYSVPKEGVQVTIELPNAKPKKKNKGFDMEAAVKRRINLIKKENQVFMHKVHILCWIAHGTYLNRTINNNDLMGVALSLIPSKHCYPPKHTDLNYLEKLVEWFVGKIIVNENHELALNNSKLPLLEVLEKQIDLKVAFSLRDLVLIFVCMVRSLGISARLVISLRPVPLRPPRNDLFFVSNKPNNKKLSNSTEEKKVSNSTEEKKVSNIAQRKKPNNASEVNNSATHSRVKKEVGGKADGSVKKSNKVSVEKISVEKNKRKSVRTEKKEPEIKSPYFSSSDEIPLQELKNRGRSTRMSSVVNLCETVSKKDGSVSNEKLTKMHRTSHPRSKKSLSALDIPEIKKENTLQPNSSASPYFNSEKNPVPKNVAQKKRSIKSVDNNKSLNESTKRGETKARKRSVVSTSYREINTSSEDEDALEQNNQLTKKCNNSDLTGRKKSSSPKKKEGCDSDFEPPKASTSRKKSVDRRVLSPDEDDRVKKIGNDYWAEVFLEAEEKWISVDLRKGKIHCIKQLYSGATHPVRYVVAWNSDGTLKDMTRRYGFDCLPAIRKLRVDDTWWKETIAPYAPHMSAREREEDEDIDRQLHDVPLPSAVGAYKNHPLYALKRHLLKFEAIYPPDAPPMGFANKEPVYSRNCVTTLHTREFWIKEAKVVRRGEEPYKIVKARPKWDKMTQTVINNIPLPLFGHWQVEDYIPPPAVDGKVPRNEYGNVEMYKPCMLPPGTVHLQVPQLARVARKLGIDCAPAVVGWEFQGGGSHPLMDGFIVCEEFKEVLLDAWDKEMDESAKRAKEKVEQRVYGNWKRLIKGLLIKERLKARYDFGVPAPEKKKKKQQLSKPGTSKS